MKTRKLYRNLVWLLPVAIILGFSPVAQAELVVQTWEGHYSFTLTKTQRSGQTGLFVKTTQNMAGTVRLYIDPVEVAPVLGPTGYYMEIFDNSPTPILQVGFKQLEIIASRKIKAKPKDPSSILGVGAGEFYYDGFGGPLNAGPATANITAGTLKMDALGNPASAALTIALTGAGMDINNNNKKFIWSGTAKVTMLPVP